MGGNQSKPKPLKVATLNFAGIAHSPFQFYSGNKQQQDQMAQLSIFFRTLYELERRQPPPSRRGHRRSEQQKLEENLSKWNIANIDKIMQRERYSPLYRRDAGISGGHLMNRAQFEEKWQQQFHKNHHYVKFTHPPTQTEKHSCKVFDYLVFKTFVEYVYVFRLGPDYSTRLQREDRETTKQEPQEGRKERRKLAVVRYQEFLESHFSKPYLQLEIKLNCVRNILQQNDILFLQDASDELLNSLRNEGVVNIITAEGVDCAILVKQGKKFKLLYDEKKILESCRGFRKEHENVLNPARFRYFPEREKEVTTVVCFVDNLMLINIHLDRTKTISQGAKIVNIMAHLIQLKKTFPALNIIAAGDFNTFFINRTTQPRHQPTLDEFYSIFKVYPDKEDVLTTKKKRTWLQPQIQKAEKQDRDCRDFIISNLNLSNKKIEVLGQLIIKYQNVELLTEEHPFDHMIISATVER